MHFLEDKDGCPEVMSGGVGLRCRPFVYRLHPRWSALVECGICGRARGGRGKVRPHRNAEGGMSKWPDGLEFRGPDARRTASYYPKLGEWQ